MCHLEEDFIMKRKGETFTEFLTALTVFGVIIAGIFEFMANQTQSLANIRDRDNLMYLSQRVCNWTISGTFQGITVKNRNILHHITHNIRAGEPLTYEYTDAEIQDGPNDIIEIEHNIVSFDWDENAKILTVKNNNASMTFSLQP